ncbi:hypothetical protein E8M24_08485 [Bacillus thuringiensis]|uniref:hypothetical protein n=1 Tax=Bacillus thuringiensis TaxID=1428 RepID=UPI00125F4AB1|nr:hypothetical protein [Bacillus thuringiensis]KAB5654608.1 hypothetical protein E8M24_08485 [Bacillus thuringiensis]HDR5271806.1 hypothetical protein [Bacillus thuringiensis]
MKWMYNLDSDNDIWTSDKYDTKEEAIQAALENWTDKMLADRASVDKEFQIGQFKTYAPWINADVLLDELYERAHDECGEVAESWLSSIPMNEGEKLQEQINKVVVEWLKEINEHPSFGSIENIETIDASKLEYKEN